MGFLSKKKGGKHRRSHEDPCWPCSLGQHQNCLLKSGAKLDKCACKECRK